MADRREQVGGDPNVATPLIDLGGGLYARGIVLVGSTGQAAGGVTTPTSVAIRTVRANQGIHRNAVTSADKVTTPSAPSVVDVTTGGSLLANQAYLTAVAAGTSFGPTVGGSTTSVTTAADASNTHVMRVTLAQSTGAEFYDLFMSVDAAPKWVARVTEAQRAAGVTVTAVGTVTATSPGAGKVDIRVPGTGLAHNVAPFTASNAYVTSGITPIDCTGYKTMQYYVLINPTDLRSIPTVQLSIMSSPSGLPGTYAQFSNNNLTLLTAVRTPLMQSFAVDVNGAGQLIFLIDTITGQGTAVTIYVDLL